MRKLTEWHKQVSTANPTNAEMIFTLILIKSESYQGEAKDRARLHDAAVRTPGLSNTL